MTMMTENSIRALPFNDESLMLGELNLTKCALEQLFESGEAQIPETELINDVLKIVDLSNRMQAVETLQQKSDIYYLEYRPLSDEIKAKYSDFLPSDTFKKIEAYEQYMNGLKKLIIAQGMMLSAFEDELEGNRYGILYTGMVKLAELVEYHLPYFPEALIDNIANSASAILKDPNLKPDKNSQESSTFSYLVGLKNTAKAVLWEIRENQATSRNREDFLSPLISPEVEREMQIQKNQAAIKWAKSQLEELEHIREAKG